MQLKTWSSLLVVSAIACAGCGSSGGGNGGGGSGGGGSTSTGTDTTSGSGGGNDGIVVTIDGTEESLTVGAGCKAMGTMAVGCGANTGTKDSFSIPRLQ
jgi:hypothetical protein